MNVNLTLNDLRLAGLHNFTPEFGTKEAEGYGVGTENLCRDIMLPFSKQRPVIISEDSATGAIEADARMVITAPNITLTIGAATFAECRITIAAEFQNGSSYIVINENTTIEINANEELRLISKTNLEWQCKINYRPQIRNDIIVTAKGNADDELKKIVIPEFDGLENIPRRLRLSVIFENGHTLIANKNDTNIVDTLYPKLGIYTRVDNDGNPIEDSLLGIPIGIKTGNEWNGENFLRAGDVIEIIFDENNQCWRNLTGNNIYSGSNDNGNYVKHRDGKIEQWKQNVGTGNEIALPLPFSDVSYFVVTTYNSRSGNAIWYSDLLTPKTKRTLTGKLDGSKNNYGFRAVGY